MANDLQPPQPLLAAGWQRGCGLMIMMIGIVLTMLSGLCTVGMTIVDLSESGHHGGEVNLSGIQYIFGLPFVVIGALIWWGGWVLRRHKPGAAASASLPPDEPTAAG